MGALAVEFLLGQFGRWLCFGGGEVVLAFLSFGWRRGCCHFFWGVCTVYAQIMGGVFFLRWGLGVLIFGDARGVVGLRLKS